MSTHIRDAGRRVASIAKKRKRTGERQQSNAFHVGAD